MKPDDPMLQKCHTILQALYGERLRGVILYGSCARHTDTADSDIDLMVLLDGPVQTAQEIRRIWEALYPVQLENDRLLSVVPVDVASYNRGDYALYRNVQTEGVPL